jgi:indole-3-glycerol phosphate synthase
MSHLPDILATIVSHKRDEVATLRRDESLDAVRGRAFDAEDIPRGFVAALHSAHESGWTAVIAEVKKGSPSKGIIRPDFDPIDIAMTYEAHGASCLSVLTDEHFFLGNLRFLGLIRERVGLPLLRKDFIIDPYQVYEARAAGADAVLLIAAILEPDQLAELAGVARELSLDILLEVHDEADLEKALATDCELIGINNRDLRTFVTDLAVTERLIPRISVDRFVVTESGIFTRADIDRLLGAGARGFLIGESLMREEDIGAKLDELLESP